MPEKKGKSAVKSPATPAKGSSPITAPGGTPPRAPTPLVKPDKWWLPPAPKAPAPVVRPPAGRVPFIAPPVQRPGGSGQPSQQPQAQASSFAQEFSVPDADYGPTLPPPPPMTGVSWGNQPSRYPGIPSPQATVNALGDLRKPPPGRVPSLTAPGAAGKELDPASFALTLPFRAVGETVKDVAQAPWKLEQAAEDFWKANKQASARTSIADLSRQIDYRPGELSVNKKYGTSLEEQKRPPQNIIGEALSRRTGGLVTPEAKLDKDKLLLSGFGGLNMGAALLNPLGTMFLEVPGRAWGAWTVERDRRQGIIDAAAIKNELTPEETAQLNNAMRVRGMPGGGIMPIDNPKVKAAVEEIDFGTPIEAVRNVFNELPDGRETFENLSPVEQIVMSVVLAPFDPINVVAGFALGGQAARRVATAQEAFDLSLLKYTGDVPVTELAASSKLFPSGPLDFLLGPRTPQTNVSLAAENALRMTDAMTAGRPAEEVADIFTMYGKFVANDATWADDAARLGMGARALTDKEAALLGTRKGLAMKAGLMGPNIKAGEAAVSVVESKYGRLTAAIIADMAGTPQKQKAVATLLDFVHKGFAPGADALAVTAGEQAAGKILEKFINASSGVLGIKAPSSTEQLANALGGAWRSWQGLHSAVQLASPGYVLRNIEGQITDVSMFENAMPSAQETLGLLNPDAFKNWWGGRAVGANRGVGAGTRGFEGGNIGGWFDRNIGKGFDKFRTNIRTKGAPGRVAAGVLGGPAAWAGVQENFFSQSIMYKAINQLKAWVWDGGAAMSDTARAGIVASAGDDVLRRVTGGLDGAIRLDQIDALEGKILGDQTWTVVPPEFSTKFRDYGTLDEVQAFVDTNKNATSAEFASRFDVWVKDRVTKAGQQKNLLRSDEAALRAELTARGTQGSNMDAEIDSVLEFNANNREAAVLANRYSDELANRIYRTTGDETFLSRARAMEIEWNKESQATAMSVRADLVEKRMGLITEDQYRTLAKTKWDELFNRRFNAWSDFIMEANAKLPPEVQADAVAMRQTVEAAIEQAAPTAPPVAQATPEAAQAGINTGKISVDAGRVQELMDSGLSRSDAIDVATSEARQAASATASSPIKSFVNVAPEFPAPPPSPELAAAQRLFRETGYADVTPPKTVIPDTVSPPPAPPRAPVPGTSTPLPNIAPGTIDPVVANKLRLVMDESMDYRRFKDFMVANWQTRYGNVTPEGARAVRTAMAEARQRLREFRVTAENYATVLRDMYLFNYGDKRMLDRVFGGLYAYPYWYTREGLAHVRRAWENPHAMWAMWNAHEQVRALNEDVSVPEWQKANLNLKTKWGMLSLPLFANFDTTYSFWAPDYKDPIKEDDAAGQMYNTLASFGSPHSAIPGIMGILAASQKKDELAYSYAYRLSSGTTLLQAATKGLPGLPDGVVAESIPPLALLPQNQMMWVPTDTGKVFVGTKADRRRVNMMIEKMVVEDTISPEEAVQVMYIIGNPYDKATANNPDYKKAYQIFRDAVAMAQEARLFQNIDGTVVPGGSFLSWLGGPGLRYSQGAETKIQQSQTAYSQLLDQREGFIAQGEAGMEKWRAAQRKFWSNPENQLYSIYILGNKSGNDLNEAYAWSVVSRVGRGYVDDPVLKASGMDKDLLGQFFEAGGIPDKWLSSNVADMQAFMASVFILGSALEMPPYPTVREQDLAGTRRRALADALGTNFFSVDPRLKELYDDYKFGGVNRKELLEQHPELGPVLDFEAKFIVKDVASEKTPVVTGGRADRPGQTVITGPSDGKHILASYYGSDAIMNRYAWMTFNEENTADKRIYDMAQDLADIARTGEYPTAKQTRDTFWKDNKEAIDRYKANVAAFKAGLDGYIAGLKKKIPIPDPKLPQYREDIAADGYFMGRVDEALTEQEASMSLEADVNVPSVSAPPSTSPYDDALSLIKNDEAKILAEQEAENKRLGYLTDDNRDTYEATLYDTVLAPQGYDPKKAMESFYAVASEGWPVYQTIDTPQELLAYKGDSLHLREQMMIDTTNKWAQVTAYVRTLTPDQLKQLKADIPDIEWVYAHAQRWDDGPSEAARADIVGLNVSFPPDGTVSISRMSTKEYESGTSNPGTGKAPSGGGSGGKKKKPTEGIDWNKYYGGEGPALPGHPRDTGRNYSGGYGGRDYGGDGQEGGYAPRPVRQPYVDPRAAEGAALMAEWDAFAGTLAERPDLLVRIQDYFSANETSAQQMLARFPDLALIISKMSPEQLARLKKAWLVWALQNGKMGSTQATRYEAAMPEFGPTLRYYSRRSGRSGLQG